MVTHTIGRVLDRFDLDLTSFPRWGEEVGTAIWDKVSIGE